MVNFLQLCSIFVLATSISGLQHELRLYTGLNQTGDVFAITANQPDVAPFRDILNGAQSYCTTGFWRMYREINYEYYHSAYPTECRNGNPFNGINSIMFQGPRDTSTQAISIYPGTYNSSIGGIGVVNVEDRIADFGFVGTFLLTTGVTWWTLYANPNFTGATVCFGPNSAGVDYHWFTPGAQRPFRSAVKGCP